MNSAEWQRYIVRFEGVESQLTGLIADTKIDEALNIIYRLAERSYGSELNKNRKLFYTQLDAAIMQIANVLKIDLEDLSPDENLQFIIASHFYTTGGHTQIAKEFCKFSKRNVIIVTDLFEALSNADKVAINDIFAPFPVLFLDRDTILGKTLFIMKLIKNLAPGKISCFNHHQDPIPLVAMMASSNTKKIFYHHSDWKPSLGASIKECLHVDTTQSGRDICAGCLNATQPIWASLPSQLVPDSKLLIDKLSNINTLSMGDAYKYFISEEDSPSSYPFAISEILTMTKGYHFHIGELSSDDLTTISNVLISKNIDRDRFFCLGRIPQGARLVQQIINPVYIPSFPIGGGLANIDIMAFGVPMLVKKIPVNGDEITLSDIHLSSLLPPQCKYWNDAESLAESVAFIKENYDEISQATLKYYLEHHSFEAFAEKINAVIDLSFGQASVISP